MPLIHKIPEEGLLNIWRAISQKSSENSKNTKKNIKSYFTQEDFYRCFPYSKASSVFTHDGEAFWRYDDFISAVDWMNQHSNTVYHNFGTDSDDDIINKLEIASFMGNFHQECGDPSLEAPYPWGYPKAIKKGLDFEGPAGGCLAIQEGAIAQPVFGKTTNSFYEMIGPEMKLNNIEKEVLGVNEDTITGVVQTLVALNQPQFGLGRGTGTGAVLTENYISVSDSGKLWGNPANNNKNDPMLKEINPISNYKLEIDNRDYASLSPVSQYGGRGAIQLSYNYNYTECSLALFGDYRLVAYPNLITTTDRINFLGKPYYFGFPGKNVNGNNQLPDYIYSTTPSARILAWAVCIWFWMDRNRSGRTISCHQAQMKPYEIGITTVNAIINNQSGLIQGSWAFKKIQYYKRICKILKISDDIVGKSIVSPPNKLSLLSQ